MKATLAPTPTKMAREMLEADRRAQKRRHRARRARKVHAAPLIRPETFEPGKAPCHCGASSAHQREAANRSPLCAAPRSGRGAAANRLSCGAAYLPRSERSERQESAWPDLLLAAILWGTALVCVGLTLAIAAGIALHLFWVE